MLDEHISILQSLRDDISLNNTNERHAWRVSRDVIRNIEVLEKYGTSALYYKSEEVGFLNRPIFRIHNEINLPLEPSSVACLSTNYYYTVRFVNVIFVPLSEPDFLLHLPDLNHGMGHYVSGNAKN